MDKLPLIMELQTGSDFEFEVFSQLL